MPQVRQDFEEYSALEGTYGGRVGDPEGQRQGIGRQSTNTGKNDETKGIEKRSYLRTRMCLRRLLYEPFHEMNMTITTIQMQQVKSSGD
jgi:hypothetical protein